MIADLTARPTHGGTHHKKSIAKDPDAFDASEKDESKRYTECCQCRRGRRGG